MTIKHSTGARNYALSSGLKGAFDGGNGRINIYTGSQPSTGDTAASGTLLATIALPSTVFGTPSSGVMTANAISNIAALASGTAGYFVLYLSNETAPISAAGSTDKRITGTITATGGGGDMTFDVITFVAGGTVVTNSLSYTAPA